MAKRARPEVKRLGLVGDRSATTAAVLLAFANRAATVFASQRHFSDQMNEAAINLNLTPRNLESGRFKSTYRGDNCLFRYYSKHEAPTILFVAEHFTQEQGPLCCWIRKSLLL